MSNAFSTAFAGLTPPQARKPEIAGIIKAYVKMTGVRMDDLVGPSKAPAITAYRHELMFLIRKLDPAASFTLIGRFIGGRDMATVHGAIVKVEQRLQRERDYGREVEGLCQHIVALVEEDEARENAAAKPWQLLAACSVLRDDQMTDAEARKAALAFLAQLEAVHA